MFGRAKNLDAAMQICRMSGDDSTSSTREGTGISRFASKARMPWRVGAWFVCNRCM